MTFLDKALADTAVMQRHCQDLGNFCTYATQRGIPLVVVIMPLLNDLAHSRTMTAAVKDFFVARKALVVDVADLVQDMAVAARTPNSQDAHASAQVNEVVADAIWQVLVQK